LIHHVFGHNAPARRVPRHANLERRIEPKSLHPASVLACDPNKSLAVFSGKARGVDIRAWPSQLDPMPQQGVNHREHPPVDSLVGLVVNQLKPYRIC